MATVTIGGITLSDWEIPEKINFGGRQAHTVHKLIGGDRVVDAMGPDPEDVRWSGMFRGPSALERATALDALRASGAEVPLFYLNRFVMVVISDFRADAERPYEIPYSITCTVTQDFVNGSSFAVIDSLDNIVGAALTVAAAFVSGTSDTQVAAAQSVATVQASVDSAGTMQGASSATLQAVETVAYASSAYLGTTATALDASLGAGSGTDAGVDPDEIASFLTAQLTACQDEAAVIGALANIDLVRKNIMVATG